MLVPDHREPVPHKHWASMQPNREPRLGFKPSPWRCELMLLPLGKLLETLCKKIFNIKISSCQSMYL